MSVSIPPLRTFILDAMMRSELVELITWLKKSHEDKFADRVIATLEAVRYTTEVEEKEAPLKDIAYNPYVGQIAAEMRENSKAQNIAIVYYDPRGNSVMEQRFPKTSTAEAIAQIQKDKPMVTIFSTYIVR